MARQPLLILFVDAFAFDYLSRRPLLPSFWQEVLPLETLLGYSSSLVPALWSGQLPDQLHVWNEYFYRPHAPYYLLHLLEVAPHTYIRDFMRLFLFRFGPANAPRVLPMMPACVESFFDCTTVQYHKFPPIPLGDAGLNARLTRAGIPYHFWYPTEALDSHRLLEDLELSLDKADVFIYGTATIDDMGHTFGANPECFELAFIELERFLLGADQLLRHKGSPNIIMISDHGMTSVSERFDLIDWLRPWELGKDYLIFLDATMARFWDIGMVPMNEIVARVEEASVGRFLEENDRNYFGLNFEDNRYGDKIYVLKPGCIFSPSFMDSPNVPFFRHPIKAMHGYEPSQASSTRAVFLYHGARPLVSKPERLIDVANVIECLLSDSDAK